MSSVASRRDAAVRRGDWAALIALLAETPIEDKRPRERLVTALERLRPPRAVPTLERIAIDEHEGRYVRTAAFEALAVIGDPAAVTTAAAVLEHAPPRVRRAAAMLLGKLGGDDAERLLLDALRNDEHKDVRAEAAEALGLLASHQAIATLADKLAAGERMFVRQESALALHRIGTADARASLRRGLEEAGPIARWRIRRWVETMQ